MAGIERRLLQNLFAFTVAHQDYYEDLGRRVLSEPGYQALIEKILPDGWSISREGVWIRCIPQAYVLQGQGFKIHLSVTSRQAAEVLHSVIPICSEAGTPFKFLVDAVTLDHVNSKNGTRTSAGKFVTIYPVDRQLCMELLEKLAEATRLIRGPYVLSDRPYRDSKAVFYRYGGFRGIHKLNLFGEKELQMLSADGELVPDLRTPYFQLPPGVVDLYPAAVVAAVREDAIVLQGRYAISRPIRFSNAGGVYLADDRKLEQRVVLKEARPLVNLSRRNSVDAIETLKKEHRVLQRMQHTSFVPRLVDFFEDWEHCFLVEEYLESVPLSSFRALTDISLLLRRPFNSEHVRDFCRIFVRLAKNLLAAVWAFHENGVLIGDLAPSNVLIDREDLSVKLIDFEGAFFVGELHSWGETTATTGFISPRRRQGQAPQLADDYYSLGSALYSLVVPVQEIFSANPAAEGRFLKTMTHDFDLPPGIGEAIFALLAGNAEKALTVLASLEEEIESREFRLRLNEEAGITPSEIQQVLVGVRDHLLASLDRSRPDRLWPADYRVFATNPLSLGYGALGTALFLQKMLGELPESVRAWIASQSIDTSAYPPGLFVGLSGVAWALEDLGDSERARHAMGLAYSSPLLHQGPDLFYGMGGVGLASLYFWSKTLQERYLVQARELAAVLERTAVPDSDGLYWVNADGDHYYGFAHGGSGIAFFLLKLYQATHDPRYLEQGKAALEYEIRRVVEQPDGSLAWPRSAADSWVSPYWRYGSAGVGSVLIRYAAALGDERYHAMAERAAQYVAVRLSVFPGQFMGISGLGEFLLDMHLFTGRTDFLRDAWRLAEGVLMFRAIRPEGILFPGDELVRFTTDYGSGSAGVSLFLQRLLQPGARRFYDFPLPPG